MENLIITLIVGAVAGWLAGLIIKGGGFGLIGNIIVGVIGAFLGNYLFDVLNISIGGEAIIGDLVTAVAGAVVLLFVIGLIKK